MSIPVNLLDRAESAAIRFAALQNKSPAFVFETLPQAVGDLAALS